MRLYDPGIARFLARDMLRQAASLPGPPIGTGALGVELAEHQYGYALNSPPNWIDPDGAVFGCCSSPPTPPPPPLPPGVIESGVVINQLQAETKKIGGWTKEWISTDKYDWYDRREIARLRIVEMTRLLERAPQTSSPEIAVKIAAKSLIAVAKQYLKMPQPLGPRPAPTPQPLPAQDPEWTYQGHPIPSLDEAVRRAGGGYKIVAQLEFNMESNTYDMKHLMKGKKITSLCGTGDVQSGAWQKISKRTQQGGILYVWHLGHVNVWCDDNRMYQVFVLVVQAARIGPGSAPVHVDPKRVKEMFGYLVLIFKERPHAVTNLQEALDLMDQFLPKPKSAR